MMTGAPGIFAGGDMVPGERTVTVAVGHGKHAARNIDAWLRGTHYVKPPKAPLVDFAMLHLPVFSDADTTAQRELPHAARTKDSPRSSPGSARRRRGARRSAASAAATASSATTATPPAPRTRSSSSGRASGYRFDYAKCTGCAACFEQCPCHAIDMIPNRPQ